MASERPVKEMCEGCGHDCGKRCDVIKDPGWIFKHRQGKCFARVTPERAGQIEAELKPTAK
jgi:hypothetical protein